MAVGADQRIGEGDAVFELHHRREFFEVDLVQDAVALHHHIDVVEGLLRPGHELETLGVAPRLDGHVLAQRLGVGAGEFDVERVVDDQLRRYHRVDLARIAAGLGHRVAQAGHVDERRATQDVLQHDARRVKRKIGVAALLDDLRQRRRLLRRRATAQHVLGEKPTGQRQAVVSPLVQGIDRLLDRNHLGAAARQHVEHFC